CGLFERFVGPMQPVLAHARRILMGQDKLDLAALSSAADQAQRDAVAVESYVENPVEPGQRAVAAVDRAGMVEALLALDGCFGPKARREKDGERIELAGPGLGRMVFACCVEDLEHDREALPLSPLSPKARDLAESLSHTGERLPLVVGSAQRDAFRCSVAYWVGEGGSRQPVTTLHDLRERVEKWNGVYPAPAEWRAAEEAAFTEAGKSVKEMEVRARRREEDALRKQYEAARLRLLRELGRYLVCLGEGTSDMNGVWYRQMNRDIASAERLKRAQDRLGGYPEWSSALCEELEGFAAELGEPQRRARLMGKELDAALDDPRWLALPALQSELLETDKEALKQAQQDIEERTADIVRQGAHEMPARLCAAAIFAISQVRLMSDITDASPQEYARLKDEERREQVKTFTKAWIMLDKAVREANDSPLRGDLPGMKATDAALFYGVEGLRQLERLGLVIEHEVRDEDTTPLIGMNRPDADLILRMLGLLGGIAPPGWETPLRMLDILDMRRRIIWEAKQVKAPANSAPREGGGEAAAGELPKAASGDPAWKWPGLPLSLVKLAELLSEAGKPVDAKWLAHRDRLGREPSRVLFDARASWGHWIGAWIDRPHGCGLYALRSEPKNKPAS
ncbi:MAG TPA: hypothetical protein P5137_14825, partial [Candidatus Brocadiia bacterium]|nr:hypothetical protein [Candidatus Brocadiia bacterium]